MTAPPFPAKQLRSYCVTLSRMIVSTIRHNAIFLLTAALCWWLLFRIPQIAYIWQHAAFPAISPVSRAYLCLAGLLAFNYGLSIFFVARTFALRRASLGLRWGHRRHTIAARQRGIWRFLMPSHVFRLALYGIPLASATWLPMLPVWPARWPRSLGVPQPPSRRPSFFFSSAWAAILTASAVLAVVGRYPRMAAVYPLAHVFSTNLAVLLALIGIWAALHARIACRRFRRRSFLWSFLGRLLGWMLASCLVGEFLWIFRWSEAGFLLRAYPLYNVWALVHLLSLILILAILADRLRCQHSLLSLPLLAGTVFLLLLWTRPMAVSYADLLAETSTTPPSRPSVVSPTEDEFVQMHDEHGHLLTDQKWFDHILTRMTEIEKHPGPFVFVAASGGGSRAAILTAFALETLSRTPIDRRVPFRGEQQLDSSVRTWADNIVLISSVSGGSLATAHYVQGLQGRHVPRKANPWRSTEAQETLRQIAARVDNHIYSLRSGNPPFREEDVPAAVRADPLRELAYWEERRSHLPPQEHLEEDLKEIATLLQVKASLQLLLAGNSPGQIEADLRSHPEYVRCAWVLDSSLIDDMCADFMAPVLRGVMSFASDRETCLRDFWTTTLGWSNCVNRWGYHGQEAAWAYEPYHPAVVLNAANARNSTRLAIGFPPLPKDLVTLGIRGYRGGLPTTLDEVAPACPVSLSQGVRLSSNFPWGFRIQELDVPVTGWSAGVQHNWDIFGRADILDGGVVDNTGIDMLHSILWGIQYHALDGDESYRGPCKRIYESLQKRPIVIVEVDAGALAPEPRSALGLGYGILGPVDALKVVADRQARDAAQEYLRRIERVLRPEVDGYTRVRLPVQALRIVANQGDSLTRQDIMTAWALGPRDKAAVLESLIFQLGDWDRKRKRVMRKAENGPSLNRIEGYKHVERLLDLEERLIARAKQGSSTDAAAGEKPSSARDCFAVTAAYLPSFRMYHTSVERILVYQLEGGVLHDELFDRYRRLRDEFEGIATVLEGLEQWGAKEWQPVKERLDRMGMWCQKLSSAAKERREQEIGRLEGR